jgi:Ni/Fe-hydrogenase subunit HybB-like protein
MNALTERINRDLLRPVLETSWKFYAVVFVSGAIVAWAVFAWGWQIAHGIGVSGKRRPEFWSLYITSFVFWIGISHAGTLISAILRVTNASWRRPVTRCAEAITVFALLIGSMFPLIHMGRVWLFYYLVPYPSERMLWPNYRSPLIWDFFAINSYLTGSLIYLFLPLLPDLALLRDKARGWRRRLYGVLSLGWRGTATQWHRLEKAVSVMAVVIIPVAVSVHTIVSWDFAMTINPMWNSTIFAPYFVAGAIFSGIAALIAAMAVLRRVLHLEAYLEEKHFSNLALLLLVMSLLWGYFTFAEYLTVWYANEPAEMAVWWAKVAGPYSPLFYTMIICCFVVPVPVIAFKRTRRISLLAFVSVLVCIGMWLERFLIIVPTLGHPRLPFNWRGYTTTWVELSIVAGTLAYFVLLYALFTKLFPIISIWELKEGVRHQHKVPGKAAVHETEVEVEFDVDASAFKV